MLLCDGILYLVIVQIRNQRLRQAHLVALREETERNMRFAVDHADAEKGLALCLLHLLRQFAYQRRGYVLDGQQHVHLLDHRVAHLRELHHRDDLELQLLVVIGFGLDPSPDEEEIIREEVLAEILVIPL